jgi:beta-N-acetylhexosaminidase
MSGPDALDELAARCLFPGFAGLVPPDWLRRWLERSLGGVVLFAPNIADADQLRGLTAELEHERPGVLVAVDEEGGDVTRLETSTGSSWPGARALGAVDDLELTARVAAGMGAQIAEAGVNVDLAPVADVDSNPENPVIGIRSFGEEPELVARHVAAFVEGLQRAGVAACAKHFPGHGDTREDSHLELATVDAGAAQLEAALLPFRAAIEAGVRAIMTAHIRVPSFDDAPATLSSRILGALLREELGFAGVVFTDALEMRAISGRLGMGEAAARAVAAGADAVVLGREIDETHVADAHAGVVAAVRSGRLGEARLAEAAARVDALAEWAAGAPRAAPPPAAAELGLDAARRALSVDGDPCVDAAPLVVELRPDVNIAAGEASHSLGHIVAERLPGATEAVLTKSTLPAADALHPDVLVLRDAGRYAWQRRAAEALLRRVPDAVVIEIGARPWRPDGARTYVRTFGGGRANLVAAAERITRLRG